MLPVDQVAAMRDAGLVPRGRPAPPDQRGERAAPPGHRQADPVQVLAPDGPQLRVVQVAAFDADAGRARAVDRGIDVYRQTRRERDRGAGDLRLLWRDEVTNGPFGRLVLFPAVLDRDERG